MSAKATDGFSAFANPFFVTINKSQSRVCMLNARSAVSVLLLQLQKPGIQNMSGFTALLD